MRKFAVSFVLLALTFAGCAGQSAGKSTSEVARTSSSTKVIADGAAVATPQTSSDSATGVKTVAPADGRQVVSNATLAIKSPTVSEASDRATALVTAAGGYLFSENAAVGTRSDAMLVFKVPPTAFATVLDQLGGLGRRVSQQITTDDVTAQVVDLEGRLASATSSTARLRTLFDRADEVADVVAIEAELVKREAEVESLQGQLRVVQAQVALATVTLTVAKRVPVTPKPEEASGFLAGLGQGWDALLAAVGAGATALGVLLPFLAVGAVAGGIALGIRRRLRLGPRPSTPAT